jgi:uncharacterized protein YycO
MTNTGTWFDYQPGDIILCQTGTEWGILKPLFKWLVGKWGHAMIYVFDFDGVPYFVEARPKKGVSVVGGDQYEGAKVAVLRSKYPWYPDKAVKEALERASDPSTLYDFNDIFTCVIKLIHEKLGRPIHHWEPDKYTICSELVWECYAEAGLELDLRTAYEIQKKKEMGIPLPGDFLKTNALEVVYYGGLLL